MRRTLENGVELAQALGARYADIRYTKRRVESIAVKDESILGINTGGNQGVGVRVLFENGWGFAARPANSEDELKRIMPDVINEAMSVAKASNYVNSKPVTLADVDCIVEDYSTPVKTDPFYMKHEEKAQFLLDVVGESNEHDKIRTSSGSLRLFHDEKYFASSDKSYITQNIIQTGGQIATVAVAPGQAERRHFRDHGTGGWELIEEMDLFQVAENISDEASQLLEAPSCPHGEYDLILGGSMLALQLHESCGHPTELDRALGSEATFAGTSFLMPDMWRTERYGSPIVNINMDATVDRGLGTFGYDDEGVPAQSTPLIKDGIFFNYTTSRETAPRFKQSSNGAMLSDGWSHIPLIRMNNICLEPGDWTLDEIIKDTKEGVLMDTSKSWSLDDKRMNFHFSCEVGWKIEDGEVVSILKNNAYTDLTPHFWQSCDAIADADHWHCWGRPSCAKGEPVQIANVGHGAAPARFRNIEIGIPK